MLENQSLFINIEGMLGESCASLVQRKVSKMPGVYSATISYTLRGGVVNYGLGKTTAKKILKQIHLAGYRATLKDEETNHLEESCVDFLSSQLKKTTFFVFPFSVFFIAKLFLPILPQAYLTCISLGLSFWMIYKLRASLYFGMKDWLVKNRPIVETILAISTLFSIIAVTVQLAFATISNNPSLLAHQLLETNGIVIFLYCLASQELYKRLIEKNKVEDPFGNLLPQTASLYSDENSIKKKKSIRVKDIQKGDAFYLNGFKKIPVDGVIVKGEGKYDESELTGKSGISAKQIGDEVLAGSIQVEGDSIIHAKEDVKSSLVSRLSQQLYLSKVAYPHPYFKHARLGFYVGFFSSFITFAYYCFVEKEPGQATSFFLSSLYAGGALFLSPVLLSVYHYAFRRAARCGIIFKNIKHLRMFTKVKNIIFDDDRFFMEKKFEVKKVKTFYSFESDASPKLHAICENAQGALWQAATEWTQGKRVDNSFTFKLIKEAPLGRTIQTEQNQISFGYVDYIQDLGVKIPHRVLSWVDELHLDGYIPMLLTTNGRIDMVVAIAEVLKPDAFGVIHFLKRKGVFISIQSKGGGKIEPWLREELDLDNKGSRYAKGSKTLKILTNRKTKDLIASDVTLSIRREDLALENQDMLVSLNSDLKHLVKPFQLSTQAFISRLLLIVSGWLSLSFFILLTMSATFFFTGSKPGPLLVGLITVFHPLLLFAILDFVHHLRTEDQ